MTDTSTPTFQEPPAVAAEIFGDRLDLAVRYYELLATVGHTRGFIGPREIPRLWDRHLLNCAVTHSLFEEGIHLVDVGSGAGLPGIPIAIARPDLKIDLVESLLKRSIFLQEVVDELGLDHVRVIRGRSEDPEVKDQVGAADVATSRAVAPLATLVQFSFPLVKKGGRIDALKGDSAAEEIARDKQKIHKLGGGVPEIIPVGHGLVAEPATVVRIVKEKARGR